MNQLPIPLSPDFNEQVIKALKQRQEEQDVRRTERSGSGELFVLVDDIAHFERVRGVRK